MVVRRVAGVAVLVGAVRQLLPLEALLAVKADIFFPDRVGLAVLAAPRGV
tara:strand:- start:186 stop:335 length:150 start_codon:yes stop_codon:yes gene_type:complete